MWNPFKKKEYSYALVKFGVFKNVDSSEENGYWYLIKEKFEVVANDIVLVPADNENGTKCATVIRVENFNKNDVPYPIEQTKEIIKNLSAEQRAGIKFESKFELVGVAENNIDKIILKNLSQDEYKIINLKCNNYMLTEFKYVVLKNKKENNKISISGEGYIESLQGKCKFNILIEYLITYNAIIIEGKVEEQGNTKNYKDIYYSFDNIID